MHKKNRTTIQCLGLTAGLILVFYLPFKVKANDPPVVSYKLGAITITSQGAIEPIPPKLYPYIRLLKWLTPITHSSIIYRSVNLTPGALFDATTIASIKYRLATLPYFSSLYISQTIVDSSSKPMVSNLVIETKDHFPITLDLSLDMGPLVTITHHNLWGYGHTFTQHIFLKKRWGYGLMYGIPKGYNSYFFGGDYYNQIEPSCKFNHKNAWFSTLWSINQEQGVQPYYWLTGLSGYEKIFTPSPPITTVQKSIYQNYKFILGKLGWVADGYTTIRGIYSISSLEKLPQGGSIEMLYGYQNGSLKNRHYIGVNCIKNIARPSLRYLHVMCASGAFIHQQRFEEIVLKLDLAYAGPRIPSCNGTQQFITINYITGYQMGQERRLAIRIRDPETLEPVDNELTYPIYTRLNIGLNSTLHNPIVLHPIGFVIIGFTDFIFLYDVNNQILNTTFIDNYGIGLHVEHKTIPLPTLTFKVGYSPLLGRIVPSIGIAVGNFKNKTDPNPKLVAYS